MNEYLEILLSLSIGSIYGFILYFTIKYTSKTVCNISRYFVVIPIIILIMILIISIIKSSIALSLGLVGALSIVRFRTPIKESEELIYLFAAIAVGLGLGAGYIVITSLVFTFIIALMLVLSLFKKKEETNNFYIEISYSNNILHIEDFNKVFNDSRVKYTITRIDNNDNTTAFVYAISLSDDNLISALITSLKKVEQSARINMINNNTF